MSAKNKTYETLLDLSEGQVSNWADEAEYRQQNRKWLRYSGAIALRVLQKIEETEGMSQKKLAEALGVSQQQISKIVKGHENLTLETISKLSEALDTELISFPEIKASHKRKKADYSIREENASVVAEPQAKYYTKAKKQPRVKDL